MPGPARLTDGRVAVADKLPHYASYAVCVPPRVGSSRSQRDPHVRDSLLRVSTTKKPLPPGPSFSTPRPLSFSVSFSQSLINDSPSSSFLVIVHRRFFSQPRSLASSLLAVSFSSYTLCPDCEPAPSGFIAFAVCASRLGQVAIKTLAA